MPALKPRIPTPFILFVLCISFTAISCQIFGIDIIRDSTQEDQEQSATVTANPVDAAHLREGSTRANPVRSGTLHLDNWEVRLLSSVRGQEAWRMLQIANQFNDPPAAGWEYLLVELSIENTSPAKDDAYLGLHVTGSRLVTHYSFDANVVAPEPRLETTLPGGASFQGWEAFLIREDEGNLMLVVEAMFEFEGSKTFMALQESTSIEFSAGALDSIVPTDIGIEPSQPVPFGQLATTEDWQIKLVDVLQGEDAWKLLYETNRFNDPPPEGMEYVLVQLDAGYIGLEDAGVVLTNYAFKVKDDSGSEYSTAPAVAPDPDLFIELYPGGSGQGWVVFLVPELQSSKILVFEPSYPSHPIENRRYFSLVLSGR